MKRPKEYYQAFVEEFEKSGMSVTEFCKSKGKSKTYFYYAKSQLAPMGSDEKKENEFIQVKVSDGIVAYLGSSKIRLQMNLDDFIEVLKRL